MLNRFLHHSFNRLCPPQAKTHDCFWNPNKFTPNHRTLANNCRSNGNSSLSTRPIDPWANWCAVEYSTIKSKQCSAAYCSHKAARSNIISQANTQILNRSFGCSSIPCPSQTRARIWDSASHSQNTVSSWAPISTTVYSE